MHSQTHVRAAGAFCKQNIALKGATSDRPFFRNVND